MDDGIDPGHGLLETALLQIDIDQLHRLALQPAPVAARPYRAADAVPGLEEHIDHVTPHEARATRNKNSLICSHVY